MTVGGQPSPRPKRSGETRQGRGGRARLSARHARALPLRMRAGWLAVLMAVLLAFSWQSFVAQTHQHFEQAGLSAAALAKPDTAGSQRPGRQSPSDLPANCAVCREIAHAGQVLLPAPVELDAPAPITFWLALTLLLGLTLAQRSHAWQSRAPPRQLQG